jgi:hypothetical protein
MPPVPGRAGRVETPFSFERPTEEGELSVSDREEMRSAAWWLRMFVLADGVQMSSCGCVNLVALAQEIDGSSPFCFIVPVLLQLVALVLIFNSARAIGRFRNRGLGLMGCILTLVLSVVQLLPCLVLLPRQHGEPTVFVCSLGMPLAVAVVGLIAGIRGMAILNKPEVVGYFRRR